MIHVNKRGARRVYPFDRCAEFTVAYSGARSARVSLLTSVRNCARHWYNVSGELWKVSADMKTGLITCTKILNSESENKLISENFSTFSPDSQIIAQ